jgi:hypothetical protein
MENNDRVDRVDRVDRDGGAGQWDSLEELIRRRRDEFDEYDAPPDVWPRVSRRLPHTMLTPTAWKGAIAACIVLLAGIGLLYRSSVTRPGTEVTVPEAPEMTQAAQYYKGLIEEKKAALVHYRQQFPQLYGDFHEEDAELDRDYADLEQEHHLAPDNELVQQAIIRNLQTQVGIIDRQLEIVAALTRPGNVGNIKS